MGTSEGSLPKIGLRWRWILVPLPASCYSCPPPASIAQATPAGTPALYLRPRLATGSGQLTCCSVIAIKCDSWGLPRAAHGFIYESGFEELGRGNPPPLSRLLRARLQKKGCLDSYTHVLCVNKCLQFYIEDGISVRASNCIFFTFIDFKTDPLYVFGAMISFMASSWYC